MVLSVNDELTAVDAITVDVCKTGRLRMLTMSPLDFSEQYKRNKYDVPLTTLKHSRHVEYEFCPIAISIYVRLGKEALCFLSDVEIVVKKNEQEI
ncbi:hypothetical protein GEMRC1_002394 [Eukaryota sp. GEM-RC1]